MKKKMKNLIDGNLFQWVTILAQINQMKNCEFVNCNIRENLIALLILEARHEGCHWVWRPNEIRKPNKDQDYFSLDSVDLNGYFDFENHNDLEEWLKNKVKKMGIPKQLEGWDFDTESSAWYPAFETKEAAMGCITLFDKLFDEKYLTTLESMASS